MIIFLDFDGVLHSTPSGERGHFYHLPRIEKILREFPFVSVVISSSWREVYPAEVILGLFPEDLQDRIIGMTPIGDGKPPYSRYEEILAWISLNDCGGGPWLALDDAELEFPDGCKELLLCKTATGFDDAVEGRLRAMLGVF